MLENTSTRGFKHQKCCQNSIKLNFKHQKMEIYIYILYQTLSSIMRGSCFQEKFG